MTASSGSIFETSHIASSITAEDALEFFDVHGLFYQENAEIGKLVDGLYKTNRVRSDETSLEYFKPTLCKDPRLRSILDAYPIASKFRHAWGIVPSTYYSWDNPSPKVDDAIIIYMLGPRSQGKCCARSHKRTIKVDLPSDDGTYHLKDECLESYTKVDFCMVDGGVLLVHPVLAHRTEIGRSIIFGAWKEAI